MSRSRYSRLVVASSSLGLSSMVWQPVTPTQNQASSSDPEGDGEACAYLFRVCSPMVNVWLTTLSPQEHSGVVALRT